MRKLIGKVIRSLLAKEKLWEIKNRSNIPSIEWSINNLKKLGFESKCAIDVGAFEGEWSKMYKSIFPNAKMVMIEAQHGQEEILRKVTNQLEATSHHISLLGAEKGIAVDFHINSTVSSVLEEHSSNNFQKERRHTQTLDGLVGNLTISPDFLKLDVQGYELEILKGSKKTLKSVQFILCEVSLIDINKNCPLITEVFTYLDKIDFKPYDICSFIRRPYDRSLWQTDVLFIRKGHYLSEIKSWN